MADLPPDAQPPAEPSGQAPQSVPAEDRNERLPALLAVARAIASQSDLEAVLAHCLRGLVDALDAADAGVLMLYAPAEDRLRPRAAVGYDLVILGGLCLAPGESITGKAFQAGRAQLYSTPEAVAAAMADLTAANRDLFTRATMGLAQPLSAISVPLIAGQEKVGVLVLENLRHPGRFGRADLAFLQQVADVIALSIENLRLREALQAAQAVGEANRLKAELISILAHEMRTPLTSIKGYATALLMEEAAFGPDTQREFLQFIDQECDLLQGLIHDLLESSIIDAGLLELAPQPVLLSRLARSVISELERHAPRHEFLASFDGGFPILECDPDRIAQVLRNLLDNAVKYSPQGGLIVVRGEVQGREAVISVADQGVGIAPEHLNRLFEKFFRIESGQGHHVVGSGLGLAIARTIVEAHGGRIWAESQVGRGSTFYFTLPLEGPARQGRVPEEKTHG